jgi:maleamate amidohydrolase
LSAHDLPLNNCGIFAHGAVAPTKRLFAAARRAGIPIFFCTQETRPNNRPPGATSTRRQRSVPADGYASYIELDG